MIIPYTTIDQVVTVSERILQYHRQSDFNETSLSIGLAQFVRHPDRTWQEDIQDLITRADKALYKSKNDGGDQVAYDSSLPRVE